MDFTENNLWWDRLAYRDSVVKSGEHYESLSPLRQVQGGLHEVQDVQGQRRAQYLIHPGVYYQNFENGLGVETLAEDERDLTNMDHWNLYGFSYYVCCSAFEAWKKDQRGHTTSIMKGIRHIHDFYMDLMVGDHYRLPSVLCPEHSPQDEDPGDAWVRTTRTREGPVLPQGGEDELELRVKRHDWFYVYICYVHDFIMPRSIMSNKTTFSDLAQQHRQIVPRLRRPHVDYELDVVMATA